VWCSSGVLASRGRKQAHPGRREDRGELVAIVKGERVRHAGRWHRRAELGADRVEHQAEPWVGGSWPPDGERQPSTGLQHTTDRWTLYTPAADKHLEQRAEEEEVDLAAA
jgi:hypothetical protein